MEAKDANVTLVVPMRDEARTLGALARSIREQVRGPDAVLLVDGGSTDGTVQVARSLAGREATWTVIEAGPASPGRGRNVGIAAAATGWVALTDAGIELDRHWLARLEETARASGADVVYGHHEPARGGWVEGAAALAYVAPPRSTDRGPVRDQFIASCIVRKSVWEAVGGFPDLRAVEDQIFMRAVAEAGFKIAVAHEARATWQLQPTLRTTFRRFRTYSKVNVHAGEQRHWHYGVARQWAVAVPFALFGLRDRRWLGVPLAGVVARTVRSVWLRREGRRARFVANPVRLAGVAVVLVTCDLAMFAGWADALIERCRGRPVTT